MDANAISKNIRKLLNRISDYRKCPACGTEVWWVTHKNRKRAPYTLEARVHLQDCDMKERGPSTGDVPEVPAQT